MLTDADRQFNGRMLLDLCAMSDRILANYGIPAQPKAKSPCEFCQGEGSVPANSGSDVADRRCPECKGKGTR